MSRESVNAAGAPAAIGPYVHAVKAGSLLFCSGQIALDPASGEIVGTTAAEQARRALTSLSTVLEAGGATLASVVKTTVYLVSMDDFASVNEVYAEFFKTDPPARVAIAVAELPKGSLVEIDAVAVVGD